MKKNKEIELVVSNFLKGKKQVTMSEILDHMNKLGYKTTKNANEVEQEAEYERQQIIAESIFRYKKGEREISGVPIEDIIIGLTMLKTDPSERENVKKEISKYLSDIRNKKSEIND